VTGQRIRIALVQEPRNVTVVSGVYTFRRAPNAPARNGIYVSATTQPARGGASHRGALDQMFFELSSYTGDRFVIDAPVQPGQTVQWFIDPALGRTPAEQSANRAVLLEHVAQQTGLTFTPARRPIESIRVWEEAAP
jgi:hypothetical protein